MISGFSFCSVNVVAEIQVKPKPEQFILLQSGENLFERFLGCFFVERLFDWVFSPSFDSRQ